MVRCDWRVAGRTTLLINLIGNTVDSDVQDICGVYLYLLVYCKDTTVLLQQLILTKHEEGVAKSVP